MHGTVRETCLKPLSTGFRNTHTIQLNFIIHPQDLLHTGRGMFFYIAQSGKGFMLSKYTI